VGGAVLFEGRGEALRQANEEDKKNRPAVAETSHSGVHCFASKAAIPLTYYLGLWQQLPRNATALKPTHKAGRRGGESIAHSRKELIFILRYTRTDTYCINIHML